MEQGKRGKRTKRILDILFLLRGTVYVVCFPWEMMGKTWMAVIPFIVLACMAWALLDILVSDVHVQELADRLIREVDRKDVLEKDNGSVILIQRTEV